MLREKGEVEMTECKQVIAELLYLKHDCLEGSSTDQTLDKAIALLKAQEPKPPIIKENAYGWKFYYCPSCEKSFYQNNKFSFCDKCGQAVKWE